MAWTETDGIAVYKMCQGDEDALAHLMRKLTPWLRRQGPHFLGWCFEEYQDEWIQDTWMRVWRRRSVQDPSRRFYPWLNLHAFSAASEIRRKVYCQSRIPPKSLLYLDHAEDREGSEFDLNLPAIEDNPIAALAKRESICLLLRELGPDRFWLLWDLYVVCDGSVLALSRLHHTTAYKIETLLSRVQAETHEILKKDCLSTVAEAA